jgi:hypothetical protein
MDPCCVCRGGGADPGVGGGCKLRATCGMHKLPRHCTWSLPSDHASNLKLQSGLSGE